MSFSDLKKTKGNAGLSAIQQKLEAMGGESKSDRKPDERFWRPEQDKTGIGNALIRFLPTTGNDHQPWVELTEYAFEGPGGWYIEKARTTIQEKDPVQDKFSELWQSGIEANRERAKKLKRKFSYIANILIVKDPANPDNEGRVFLYKFGKQIFDKIRDEMFPKQDALDDTPKVGVNVFCPWEGSNFKLRISKVEGYPNYNKSEFASPAALYNGDDDAIKNLWESQHELTALIAPDQFKSYEDLSKRLERVLGVALPNAAQNVSTVTEKALENVSIKTEDFSENDDDDMSYLQQLASDDEV
jgi:hypothetical protein